MGKLTTSTTDKPQVIAKPYNDGVSVQLSKPTIPGHLKLVRRTSADLRTSRCKAYNYLIP
jgi:hypothetical protein